MTRALNERLMRNRDPYSIIVYVIYCAVLT